MSYQHIKLAGFGCTYPLEHFDDSGDVVFNMRRLVRGEHVSLDVSSPTFIAVIEAGKGRVYHNRSSVKNSIDFSHVYLIPKNYVGKLEPITPTLKIIMMTFKPEAIAKCVACFNLSSKNMEKSLTELGAISRSTWVNELCHRYAFERSIAKMPSSLAAQFVEAELLKEYYYGVQANDSSGENTPFYADYPDPLMRALRYIELHFQNEIDLVELSRYAFTKNADPSAFFIHCTWPVDGGPSKAPGFS